MRNDLDNQAFCRFCFYVFKPCDYFWLEDNLPEDFYQPFAVYIDPDWTEESEYTPSFRTVFHMNISDCECQ